MSTPKVAVVMGSLSDLDIMLECVRVLKSYDIPFEVRVMSAHRCPDVVAEFAGQAAGRGLQILIAGPGLRHIWPELSRPIAPCRSSVCRWWPLRCPGSMPCSPRSRCPEEFRLPRWESASREPSMRLSWRPASWPWVTTSWQAG